MNRLVITEETEKDTCPSLQGGHMQSSEDGMEGLCRVATAASINQWALNLVC